MFDLVCSFDQAEVAVIPSDERLFYSFTQFITL